MATVLRHLESPCVLINSVADHAHVLFELSRKLAWSEAVEENKTSSSKLIKTQGPNYVRFAWQADYGAFAVSESNVTAVRCYMEEQRKHHREMTFQEEFLAFLRKHNVSYNEKYIRD